MTSSSEQPPKEYIITEEQVEYIEPEFPITAMRIRSRQHPAPAPCPQHQIWQHCPVAGEIARKAREDAFDEAIKIVLAYERKPKYDFEATLCSVIVESLDSAKKEERNG